MIMRPNPITTSLLMGLWWTGGSEAEDCAECCPELGGPAWEEEDGADVCEDPVPSRLGGVRPGPEGPPPDGSLFNMGVPSGFPRHYCFP
jgi:hypothetical protein